MRECEDCHALIQANDICNNCWKEWREYCKSRNPVVYEKKPSKVEPLPLPG